LLRRDIYALACVTGGVYFLCIHLNLSTSVTELIAALIVILVRVIAFRFHIHLPVLNPVKNNYGDKVDKT
jgi:uncharacterized membrane protein YeiH